MFRFIVLYVCLALLSPYEGRDVELKDFQEVCERIS